MQRHKTEDVVDLSAPKFCTLHAWNDLHKYQQKNKQAYNALSFCTFSEFRV